MQCATREAGLRRRVYPNSSLSAAVKERELTNIDAIVTVLGALSRCPEAQRLLVEQGARFQIIDELPL